MNEDVCNVVSLHTLFITRSAPAFFHLQLLREHESRFLVSIRYKATPKKGLGKLRHFQLKVPGSMRGMEDHVSCCVCRSLLGIVG